MQCSKVGCRKLRKSEGATANRSLFPLLTYFLYLQNLGGGKARPPGPPDGYGPSVVKLAVMMMMITMTVAHFIDE